MMSNLRFWWVWYEVNVLDLQSIIIWILAEEERIVTWYGDLGGQRRLVATLEEGCFGGKKEGQG